MNQLSPDEGFGKRVRLAAAEFGSTDNLPPLRSYLSLSGNPVASWFNGSIQEIHNLDQVLACAKRDADTSQRAICVIENISWDWLCTIGNAWDIEPIFFAGHGVNPTGDDAWLTLFPKHRESPTVPPAPSRHKYVDGVFEYHYLAKDSMAEEEIRRGILRSSYRRRCWIPKSSYSPSCSTRMSYCRVNANLYLFLVDPPLYPASYDTRTWDDKTTASSQEDRMKTALQLQCNTTGDGIAIPQLLKRKVFSLRQALQKVFRHNWHSHILFDQCDYAISRGELLHLMTASLHQSNFTAIHEEVKSISFHELRKPNMSTNTKLLNLREALADLSASTGVTSKYVPRHVRVFYKDLYNRNSGLKDHLGFQSPVDRLITIKREARDLERFLMDSFQLLMSSISVLETQRGAEQALISIEQAARTTRLTQLAFVYVPLTFVTSIFGMNVKEISEPLPPLWVCFVTLAVVAAGTAALLGGIELFIIKKKTTGDNWAAKGNLMLSPNSSANQVGDLQQARGKIDYQREPASPVQAVSDECCTVLFTRAEYPLPNCATP